MILHSSLDRPMTSFKLFGMSTRRHVMSCQAKAMVAARAGSGLPSPRGAHGISGAVARCLWIRRAMSVDQKREVKFEGKQATTNNKPTRQLAATTMASSRVVRNVVPPSLRAARRLALKFINLMSVQGSNGLRNRADEMGNH
jgi:hypothetical protein